MSERLAIFAYGSLVSPASAAETLGRPVELAALALLEGWSRGWTTCRDNLSAEKTFARAADRSLPRHCLGLGLEPDERAAAPNGALIEVTEAELERLDLREMRYERVDVTEAIRAAGGDGSGGVSQGFDRVVAYRARPEHRRPDPLPEDAVIIATYLATIEAAFAELGHGELARFRATTEQPPVEVVDAVLVRDRIPAGNPRAW